VNCVGPRPVSIAAKVPLVYNSQALEQLAMCLTLALSLSQSTFPQPAAAESIIPNEVASALEKLQQLQSQLARATGPETKPSSLQVETSASREGLFNYSIKSRSSLISSNDGSIVVNTPKKPTPPPSKQEMKRTSTTLWNRALNLSQKRPKLRRERSSEQPGGEPPEKYIPWNPLQELLFGDYECSETAVAQCSIGTLRDCLFLVMCLVKATPFWLSRYASSIISTLNTRLIHSTDLTQAILCFVGSRALVLPQNLVVPVQSVENIASFFDLIQADKSLHSPGCEIHVPGQYSAFHPFNGAGYIIRKLIVERVFKSKAVPMLMKVACSIRADDRECDPDLVMFAGKLTKMESGIKGNKARWYELICNPSRLVLYSLKAGDKKGDEFKTIHLTRSSYVYTFEKAKQQFHLALIEPGNKMRRFLFQAKDSHQRTAWVDAISLAIKYAAAGDAGLPSDPQQPSGMMARLATSLDRKINEEVEETSSVLLLGGTAGFDLSASVLRTLQDIAPFLNVKISRHSSYWVYPPNQGFEGPEEPMPSAVVNVDLAVPGTWGSVLASINTLFLIPPIANAPGASISVVDFVGTY